MPTRLLLARHGAIDWSGKIGAPDDGLNDLGRSQAEALARRLVRHNIVALYSSTLPRALETAQIMAGRLGLPVLAEPRLREWDPGEWMGLSEDEVRAQDRGKWRIWRPAWWRQRLQTDSSFRMPGAETFWQLQRRVVAASTEIAASHPDGSVLLISHGGALSALVCHALGMDFGRASRKYFKGREPFKVDNCSLSVVEIGEPHPVLIALNDVSHLEGLT